MVYSSSSECSHRIFRTRYSRPWRSLSRYLRRLSVSSAQRGVPPRSAVLTQHEERFTHGSGSYDLAWRTDPLCSSTMDFNEGGATEVTLGCSSLSALAVKTDLREVPAPSQGTALNGANLFRYYRMNYDRSVGLPRSISV